jgi:Zn-finger nucleic acid-binding protein
MAPVTHDRAVTIDHCPFCEAIWFDASELDKMLAHAGGAKLEHCIPDRGLSALTCPRCRDRMLHASGWSGIIIDRCRACRGLFLDAPEFKALVREGPPKPGIEQTLQAAATDAGFNLLGANGLIRFLKSYWRS